MKDYLKALVYEDPPESGKWRRFGTEWHNPAQADVACRRSLLSPSGPRLYAVSPSDLAVLIDNGAAPSEMSVKEYVKWSLEHKPKRKPGQSYGRKRGRPSKAEMALRRSLAAQGEELAELLKGEK
jgi:hypothetical protein